MIRLKHFPILAIICCLLLIPMGSVSAADLFAGKEKEIEAYIEQQMSKGDIPGVSIVILQNNKPVFTKGFGYADQSSSTPVTSDTVFELGSTSKAFTGIAVLRLVEEGKLHLEDTINRYIPTFKVTYEGKPVDITLYQLLHHTSGIPFDTIGDIPIADGDDALLQTVKTLEGLELDDKPGETYSYATINYDVLGYIIQLVTGKTYEQYVTEQVLNPLGLQHTYLFRGDVPAEEMAKGYKFNLLRTIEYDAPVYRGNTPAGYVMSSANDIGRWLSIQLGQKDGIAPTFPQQIIDKSHAPDRTVMPGGDGSSYAAGWTVHQRGSGEITHGGENPNFSSAFLFRPQDGIGVGVLANLNSTYTQTIGHGIMQMLLGKELPDPATDQYKSMDNTASAILFISIPAMLMIIWFSGTAVWEAVRGKRRYAGSGSKLAANLLISLLFMSGFTYCLYRIPDVIYGGLSWSFVKVWAPQSFITAIILLFFAVLLFNFYFIWTTLFPKKNDRSMFTLTLLSIASGFGNALIIFIVNETLNRDDGFQGGLLLYFAVGIAIYVVGQKLVRTRLIYIANDMVYEKRAELIDKILDTPYQRIEGLEDGSIQASLNNDTETISEFSGIVITGATSFVTLICCFVYMGIISVYGLIVSVAFIFIAAGLHFAIGRQANKLWEQTRDIQNVFFKFINDLITGFKELSLHDGKKQDFKADMQASCNTYREKRIQGGLKFANVNVIGELLFTLVIGAVAFLFPLLFTDLKVNALRNYVFVLLYMTGPVHGILGTIPNIFRVRISWNRISELSKQLDEYRAQQQRIQVDHTSPNTKVEEQPLDVELRAVEYQYDNKEGDTFTVGPIHFSFRAGEITFITGGNGSGKSTLAKLITGLYTPTKGEVFINGQVVDSLTLGQKYAAIFSDFHLFEKLYGLETEHKETEIQTYLRTLHLQDKVNIEDGKLNTIKLSTGQRKRLALLISYLEDRPIYLFDEWAADQDPEFRAFFYHTLLPELRQRGKCIIAITHDDRFFELADHIIKMDMGQIVRQEAGRLPEIAATASSEKKSLS
ncbi:cyclic peptide export ABC transporter [Paenibacillus sp. UMB4589-SE434]|uniref:cyclic peptide export ABC transporter n=1 Tax=Paenibacillus sp. UMB4589-SE434 TaxID=3046314 RepID=UPI002549DF93|nr:cyclic peptide export ABC transporter [Paenibacillus sp. UMB4589-SE434]MDK8180491.1 cyclic peptide export ABC transporter [Paenibacillus sp. UMB4589-SE434]